MELRFPTGFFVCKNHTKPIPKRVYVFLNFVTFLMSLKSGCVILKELLKLLEYTLKYQVTPGVI